ncbi:MAG: Ig-like domain-containing protein [Cyanobacteria bacterium J06633_2]
MTSIIAGNTGITENGGSLNVSADGGLTYVPPNASFTGEDRFAYRIENEVGTSDATVTLAVGDRPNAVTDAYTSIGNVGITVDDVNGILSNDAGDLISLIGFGSTEPTANNTAVNGSNTITTSNGSTVLLNTDGSFTYTPATGYVGIDTFFYSIENGFGTVSGQVDITIDDIVWYIDNSLVDAGDGSRTTPFNSLSAFNTLNDGVGNNPGDDAIIYLGAGNSNYTGGLVFRDGQVLIGQGATGSFSTLAGITVPAESFVLPSPDGSSTPTIENVTGDGITLANTNHIYGVTIGDTLDTGIAGTGFGTLTLADTSIIGTGRLLDLSTGTLDATFTELLSTSSTGGAAIALDTIATTGNNVQVTVATDISNGTNGIQIQNSSAGASFSFNSTTITDSGTGVDLSNNAGAAIDFSNLNVSESTAGSGLIASGGGQVSVGDGSIEVTNGTGLNLDVVTADVRLSTIRSTGSASRGMNLNALANGSSVTITSDLTLIDSTTEGIYINTAPGAAITVDISGSVSVTNAGNEGIHINQTGTGSSIDLGDVLITDRNTTGILIADAEGSIRFNDAVVENGNNAAGYGIRAENSSADLTFNNLSIQDTATSVAQTNDANGNPTNDGDGDALFLLNQSGNVRIEAGSIQTIAGDGIDARSLTGTLDLIGLNIDEPSGDGIQLINPTNTMVFDSVIITGVGDNQAAIDWRGTINEDASLTLQSPLLRGDVGTVGDVGVALTTQENAYDATLTIDSNGFFSDPSTLSDFDEAAIALSIGENAGSGTATVIIQDTAVSSGTGIDVSVNGTATLNTTLQNNTVNTVGTTLPAITFNANPGTASYVLPGYTGSADGESNSGTASADLDAYLDLLGNSLTSGAQPVSGSDVDARDVMGVTG